MNLIIEKVKDFAAYILAIVAGLILLALVCFWCHAVYTVVHDIATKPEARVAYAGALGLIAACTAVVYACIWAVKRVLDKR